MPKEVKKLPEVLSRAEVARLLASTTTLRERALLMTTYGGSLRVSEVVRLRVSDIDAQRGMLRIRARQGAQGSLHAVGAPPAGRAAPLLAGVSARAAVAVPAAVQGGPDGSLTAQKIYYAAKQRAGITKAGGIHALRHAFAPICWKLGRTWPFCSAC